MAVTLRKIDDKNFWAVIKLDVGEGQESFVAPNVRSIAECVVYPYLFPNAIYSDDELVGFALYGRDPESLGYWIVRLMIDAAHQGKGFGKAATHALIDKMKNLPKCSEIFLSFVPDNSEAEHLYRMVGFEPTGETDDSGEIIMRYVVSKTETEILPG